MSFLTPPLPSSPPSPWKFNRRNKTAASQDFDRSSGSECEHEDPPPAQPAGIDLDPGRKKIFGVSLSIATPQPALRKIKYKPDKKESAKDKITAKLLLNSRLSATIAAIEEEKKKDLIIADLSQQRASEIAQSIQEKRDKEEKWKYGRHRTYKKLWTPRSRAVETRKSRSKSPKKSKPGKEVREKEHGPVFKDWASFKAATQDELDEYRKQQAKREKKMEKYAAKGKLPSPLDQVKPVFDLTDTVIRPRSLYAFAHEGSALVSYPLKNVHFTEATPSIKWSPHPRVDKPYYVPRKVFTAHADRIQQALFAAIADSRTLTIFSPDEEPSLERQWYPNEIFLQILAANEEAAQAAKVRNTTIIVESVDEKIAAAKKAIEDKKQAMLRKDEEEVAPPMPPPFLSSFKPIGSPEPPAEIVENPAEPKELVSEYEEFLKMVTDKDPEVSAKNNDWDSDSDAEGQAPLYNPPAEIMDTNSISNSHVSEVNAPEEASENLPLPPVEVPAIIKDFQLNIDTLGKDFQETWRAPIADADESKESKKSKKKEKKKASKKYASSSSDSESSDSEDENKKKRKKKKKKLKKRKRAQSSSESSSDSETEKKRKRKKGKKSDLDHGIADKLLLDLQLKRKEIAQKLSSLQNITDKKTRKSLMKELEEELEKIEQLETLLLKQSKKRDKKRRKRDSSSSSSSGDDFDIKKKAKKKSAKKKSKKRKESSSSDSSDDDEKSRKKKRSKKEKANKDRRKSESDQKNDENISDKSARKRPAEDDIVPIDPKNMFIDFASSGWVEKGRTTDDTSQSVNEPSKIAGEDNEAKMSLPRSVRDVTNTLKMDEPYGKDKNQDWENSVDYPGPPGTYQAITVASTHADEPKKSAVEFRAFQAISVVGPPGVDPIPVALSAPARDIYSPGASESEVSQPMASPTVSSTTAKPSPRTNIEPSQIICSDSQTSTSFFNVASAEESRDVNPVLRVKKFGTASYLEDDLVPPGMESEACIFDKPPQPSKYSYETGGLFESSSDGGSDMSVDMDPAGRRIKSKIKSLKMQTKMKIRPMPMPTKPSAMVSPVKLFRDSSSLGDKDIPEEASMSPANKKPKAPMTVESVFYQDSDSDEDDVRPPLISFASMFPQEAQEIAASVEKYTEPKVQPVDVKNDDLEKNSKVEKKRDKRDRSRDRRKSSTPPRRHRRSRSPDKRINRRSPDRRDSKRFSRSPDRRHRRQSSPKRRRRSHSPRRRRKDRRSRSRSRSRSYSPRNKRSKRRSRSRSPRRGDSPRTRNSDPFNEENAGRIPVLGTTIPAPLPAGLFSGEDKPPNGTSHRLSLDQRIELELGVKVRNTPPMADPQSSCYYPPYNVSHYPYGPSTVVQMGNMMEVIPTPVTPHPNSTQQTNIVQVGNVLQVVPLARATAVVAPTPVAPEPPVVDPCQNPLVKAIQAERERRKKEKEARKAEREERRKARQAKRDAKHMTIAEKLKLSNSLIADLIDMKAERNEGLVLGQDMEDEELLLEALDPPSPPGNLEIVVENNMSAASKSILVTPGYNSNKEASGKKNVKFADGLLPGEESESDGENAEKPEPKPKLPKEKRFKKKLKKKIKVQVVRQTPPEPAEIEEDPLPPPSPPPGDPPPIMYASFPFGGQVQYPVYQIGATSKLSTIK